MAKVLCPYCLSKTEPNLENLDVIVPAKSQREAEGACDTGTEAKHGESSEVTKEDSDRTA